MQISKINVPMKFEQIIIFQTEVLAIINTSK